MKALPPPGAAVRLHYVGLRGVPLWLSGTSAEVLRHTRTGRLVVQADIEIRNPRTLDDSEWTLPTEAPCE